MRFAKEISPSPRSGGAAALETGQRVRRTYRGGLHPLGWHGHARHGGCCTPMTGTAALHPLGGSTMQGIEAATKQAEENVALRACREFDQPAAEPRAIPRHLAVILDGNRRWAKNHALPVIAGYRAGGKNVPALLRWCQRSGIEVVTLWPLSADNLTRSAEDVQALITVIDDVVQGLAAEGQWRIRLIGQVDRLPPTTRTALRDAERSTAELEGMTVNIAVAYDGRAEITSAVQALLRERSMESLVRDGITQEDIAARLQTHGQPDPDLIVRTSGEQRLSGFMPWQTAYTEIFFCPRLWPDFTETDFECALEWYGTRRRRFGQ